MSAGDAAGEGRHVHAQRVGGPHGDATQRDGQRRRTGIFIAPFETRLSPFENALRVYATLFAPFDIAWRIYATLFAPFDIAWRIYATLSAPFEATLRARQRARAAAATSETCCRFEPGRTIHASH
eukprot:6197861-Pleurochrysis_carterae.AAC.1